MKIQYLLFMIVIVKIFALGAVETKRKVAAHTQGASADMIRQAQELAKSFARSKEHKRVVATQQEAKADYARSKEIDKEIALFEHEHPEVIHALRAGRDIWVKARRGNAMQDFDKQVLAIALEDDQEAALNNLSEGARKELVQRIAQQMNPAMKIFIQHNDGKLYEAVRKDIAQHIQQLTYKPDLKDKEALKDALYQKYAQQFLALEFSQAVSELLLQELIGELAASNIQLSTNVQNQIKKALLDDQSGRLKNFFINKQHCWGKKTFFEHVVPVGITADGKEVVVSNINDMLTRYKESDKGYVLTESHKFSRVRFVLTSKDGSVLVAAHARELVMYNNNFEQISAFKPGGIQQFKSLSMSHDGAVVVVGLRFGLFEIYARRADGKYKLILSEKGLVQQYDFDAQVAVSGDGSCIFVGMRNKLYRYNRSEAGVYRAVGFYDYDQGDMVTAAVTNNDGSVVAAVFGNTLFVYRSHENDSTKNSRLKRVITTDGEAGSQIAMYKNGDGILVISQGKLYALDYNKQRNSYRFSEYPLTIQPYSLAVNEQGTRIVVGSNYGQTCVYTRDVPALTLEQINILHDIYTLARENKGKGIIPVPDATFALLPPLAQKNAYEQFGVRTASMLEKKRKKVAADKNKKWWEKIF